MITAGRVAGLIQAMGGGADPAVIESAVQDWLDQHPEATTTVADGSITEQKLATTVAQKLGLISSLSDEIVVVKSAFDHAFDENKFNINLSSELNTGYINVSNGSVTAGDGTWKYTNYIPVVSNALYKVLSYGHRIVASIAFYNANKEYISGIAGTDANRWVDTTVTPVENAKYIIATFHTADVSIPDSEKQFFSGINELPSVPSILVNTENDYSITEQETARDNIRATDNTHAYMMDIQNFHSFNYDTKFLYAGTPFSTGFIQVSDGKISSSNDGTWYASKFFKINSNSVIKYRLSGHTAVASVAFYDLNKNYISGIAASENTEAGRDISSDNVSIPNGAAYLRYTMYCGNDFPSRRPKQFINFFRVPEIEDKRSISILFMGNSLTLDAISYLPYMLYTYYPDIDFHLYSWHCAGHTLAQQYQKFINDEECTIFSVAENTPTWTKSTIKMSVLLQQYKFDVVTMQDYYSYREATPEESTSDWIDCQNYIQSHYTGGNSLKFVALIPQPLRTNATNKMVMTMNAYKMIMQTTVCEDVIAAGLAVYNALSTELDELGDLGHLSSDNLHTQEGLPCLLQTFTVLLWLFNSMGINKSVYGSPARITQQVETLINVPDPQVGTGVITGTDAQNVLAQEVAIKSFKECKKFVADNLVLTT